MFMSDLRRIAASSAVVAHTAIRDNFACNFASLAGPLAPRPQLIGSVFFTSHSKAFFSQSARPLSIQVMLKRHLGRPNATASFASFGTVSSHGADHGADGADSVDVLTRKILACQSRDEVLALFESSSQSHTNGDLNHFHIGAFFKALLKLEGKDVASDARFINLVELARLRFSEADGATTASIIQFCAQIGAKLSDDWLAGFWKSSDAKLPGLNARQLSHTLLCTLRACGKMGVVPPQFWMDSLWKSIQAVLSDSDARGSSKTFRMCGEMSIVPPQFWMDCFWKTSSPRFGFNANGMAVLNTFHACGKLRLTPPQPWLAVFWKSSEDKLSGFNAKGLSSTLLACGRLGLVPPQPWMVGFSTSCEAALPHFNQHELANTLMALAILKQWSSPIVKPIWCALQRSLADSAKVDANRNLHLKQMYFAYKVASVERPGLLVFDAQGLQEEASRWRANQSENEAASPLEKEVHKFLADFERGV
jgi:hypothetical protein